MIGLPDILQLINRPEDYIIDYPLYRWYRGIIEDVADPEQRGRVRVRVESVWKNSPKTLEDEQERVTMEELPWAEVLIIGQGDKSGFMYVPPVGTAVVVAFDKGYEQYPLVIGSWFGVSNEDDNTEIPIAARGGDQTGETADDLKGLDTGVTTAGGGTIDEPDNPYGAEYPKNTVMRFPTGHLVEFDETEGAERINIAHKSGTWAEFHPDGSLVFGIQGKRYTVVEGDDGEHIKGNQDVVVDGDATFKATGSSTTEITGDATLQSTGDMCVQSLGGKTAIKALSTVEVLSPQAKVSSTGATTGNVVTTGTHPVDYITGIPIVGLPNFTAGP